MPGRLSGVVALGLALFVAGDSQAIGPKRRPTKLPPHLERSIHDFGKETPQGSRVTTAMYSFDPNTASWMAEQKVQGRTLGVEVINRELRRQSNVDRNELRRASLVRQHAPELSPRYGWRPGSLPLAIDSRRFLSSLSPRKAETLIRRSQGETNREIAASQGRTGQAVGQDLQRIDRLARDRFNLDGSD